MSKSKAVPALTSQLLSGVACLSPSQNRDWIFWVSVNGRTLRSKKFGSEQVAREELALALNILRAA